jgi:Fe(3+) dicitrate transport protein
MNKLCIHRRPRGTATSILTLAASLAATSPALAQQEPAEPVVLEPIEVEADWLGSPTPEQVRTYSGARTIVDEEDLHERGALNIEDALRPVPGVHVLDETGTGILPNISVRGLNPLRSERAQILLDGYPIAIGPYSNIGLSLFPITLASIQTIDIVRGGAAVHYGPNNVGGVLNFISRPIPTEFSQTLRERLTVFEESGNLLTDTYYRAGGFLTEDLGLQLQVNAIRGDGFREHSDTEVNNFILDGVYFPNDRNELRAQLQYYQVEAELPGALSPAAYEADRTQSQRPFDRFDADMLRGTLTWVFSPSADTEFEWRNFAHDADRTFFFGQNLSGTGNVFDPAIPATHVADSPRLFRVYGTEPRLTHRIGRHTITLGARYVTEDVQFDVNREELATGDRAAVRAWSFDTDAIALYVSDTIRLLDGRLAVTPGLRYEDVEMDFRDAISGNSDTNDAEELLPGLTVGYQASEQLFLFTNAQRSLVPVQTAQVTREGDVANETAWNYEIGARFAPRSDISTQATLFRIDYEDQIQFNRAVLRFENLGETRLQGVELQAAWQASQNLELSAAYTFLDTEQRSGANAGNELPNAPEHQVSIGGDYSYGPWELGATGVYVSESFSDAANTGAETANGSAGELPSYFLVNARVGRELKLGGLDASVGLAVNNLLDEEYYFRGVDVSPVGRVPGPGRSFILEGQVNF